MVISDSLSNKTSSSKIDFKSNLKLIYPRRFFGKNIISSFHPKLILVKFEFFLRIVIGSGNTLKCDWEDYANAFFKLIAH